MKSVVNRLRRVKLAKVARHSASSCAAAALKAATHRAGSSRPEFSLQSRAGRWGATRALARSNPVREHKRLPREVGCQRLLEVILVQNVVFPVQQIGIVCGESFPRWEFFDAAETSGQALTNQQ